MAWELIARVGTSVMEEDEVQWVNRLTKLRLLEREATRRSQGELL